MNLGYGNQQIIEVFAPQIGEIYEIFVATYMGVLMETIYVKDYRI